MWALTPLGINSYRLEGMGTSCTFDYATRSNANRGFFLALVNFNFFIPLLLITYSYWRIYSVVRNIKREVKLIRHARRHSSVRRSSYVRDKIKMRAEVKTAMIAGCIIFIFCVSWTPYVVVAFYGLFAPTPGVSPLASMWPNIIAKVSTCTNPILYSIGHPEVRNKIKRLFADRQDSNSWRMEWATAGDGSPPQSDNCLTGFVRQTSYV